MVFSNLEWQGGEVYLCKCTLSIQLGFQVTDSDLGVLCFTFEIQVPPIMWLVDANIIYKILVCQMIVN